MSGTANRPAGEALVPVLVRMPASLHATLKAKAAAEERTMAQTIRHALRLYLERPASPEAR